MRRSGDEAPPRDPVPVQPSRAAPVALFLVVAIALTAAGAFSYGAGAADLRRQEEHELATIALLKVREVSRWRDERLADAGAIAVELAAELLEREDPRRTLRRWHEALRTHHQYLSVAFVSADERQRLVGGAPDPELDDPTLSLVRRSLQEHRPSLTPLHRHPGDGQLHLDVMAPVTAGDGRRLGSVLLQVDPFLAFFPMLQSWPRHSETAEVLLVRTEDGDALGVNDLREEDRAPAIPRPLRLESALAARIASGAHGVAQSVDHLGRSVLAATVPVPDSPWTLVAQVETREAFAPIRALRFWIGGVAAALVLSAGAAAALWWRTQAQAFERVRMADEAERRALARKLENLTRYAHDMVILADAGSRVVDVNDRAAQALGYSREELVGMPVQALRDPATLGDFELRTSEQIARGALVFETRYRRKDGSTFPVEVSVHTDVYEGQRYFQAIVRDVTARAQAAEALRASEAKFRAAFEFASLGIVLLAPDGRLVETNRAFRRMLGYAEEELRGLSLAGILFPSDDVALSHFAQLVAGTRDTDESPRRYRRKDGSGVETLVRAVALRDEARAFQLVLSVVEDVSEKKQLEAQLVLAERLASIGTLAAGVAHEINNPLAFILSNLDYVLAELREQGADEELSRALQDAWDGAVRVREIVRDLRTFSRPGDDDREPLDVRSVLRTSVGLAANEIRHRAELVVEPGDVPPVIGSEHRLGQVFLNLLINAAHAIPEGASGHVVRAATSTAADGRALVEVSDTGAGIPPEVMPRIFDPFFTTKPVGVGTGLGLSICHGIVAHLGGEITVESSPGKGSTFRVYLPTARGTRAGPAEPRSSPPAAAGRRARVLVVDDEALVGRAVVRMLAPRHEAVARTSGLEALELLAADPAFDVIVCDLMMPEMTGMELHAHLLATAPGLAARTVFLTGGAFTPTAAEFLAQVPNPCLEKPFGRRELDEAVARIASRTADAAA